MELNYERKAFLFLKLRSLKAFILERLIESSLNVFEVYQPGRKSSTKKFTTQIKLVQIEPTIYFV